MGMFIIWLFFPIFFLCVLFYMAYIAAKQRSLMYLCLEATQIWAFVYTVFFLTTLPAHSYEHI